MNTTFFSDGMATNLNYRSEKKLSVMKYRSVCVWETFQATTKISVFWNTWTNVVEVGTYLSDMLSRSRRHSFTFIYFTAENTEY